MFSGGINYDYGNSIVLDDYNSLYTVGQFQSTLDFDPSAGGMFNLTANGSDIFVQKMTLCNLDLTVNLIGQYITSNQIGASYQWINCVNKALIVGETNQTYTPINNGNYAVIVTVGACSDTSNCLNVNTVNIHEDGNHQIGIIYPNPTNGLFTIGITSNSQVTIINTLGEIVFNQVLYSGKQNIDLQNQADGVYFVKVVSEGKQKVSKLLKQQ